MKRKTFTFICVTVAFLSFSCHKTHEPQIAEYSVAEDTRPLSDSDIAACFKALGLQYERFTCMLPARTGVRFSSVQYINGQERGSQGSGTTYVEQGNQRFFLFLKDESNRIEFTLASPTGSVGCGSASVEGYHAKTWGWIPIKQLKPDKQPVFLYAANHGDIEGFSTPITDLEKAVAKYDFAMVIYASLAGEE